MTRIVTLSGYALVAILAFGFEIAARRSGRFATFSQALDLALRRRPVRVLIQVGWLWLGWHLFVRVDWR
ncbi:MAG: DUF6186 family protein [Actinomycetota bacterium]|nr:DUF6186 family protein [Actinomycetota bacterium]